MSRIDWAGPPIQVIGVGPNPASALPRHLRALLEASELVVGAQRHLDGIGAISARRCIYPTPLDRFHGLLREARGKRVTVLASGDPLLFGIGAWLGRHLPSKSLRFHPNVSSIQAAFASIGLPWHEARIVSLHGRPLRSLLPAIRMNRTYAVLTDATNNPTAVAGLLMECGFENSVVWVAEDLCMPSQQVCRYTASELGGRTIRFSPLNVVIVHTQGSGGVIPEFPGIPDQAFTTGAAPGQGMLTKREVRVAALNLLQTRATEIAWDVGAGCGGISVEWAFWAPLATIYAVEMNRDRVDHLRANRDQFGVMGNLEIVTGRAPEALQPLPDPDAIYVGGSDGNLAELLDAVWNRLRRGGRLVAAAVTEESRSALLAFGKVKHPEWLEISVSRGDSLGNQTVMRPSLPVLLSCLVKPGPPV